MAPANTTPLMPTSLDARKFWHFLEHWSPAWLPRGQGRSGCLCLVIFVSRKLPVPPTFWGGRCQAKIPLGTHLLTELTTRTHPEAPGLSLASGFGAAGICTVQTISITRWRDGNTGRLRTKEGKKTPGRLSRLDTIIPRCCQRL